jgi:hypothetical protein
MPPLSPTSLASRRLDLTDPDSHRFFHLTMAAIAVLFLVGSAIGLYLTRTGVPLGQIAVRLVLLSVLLALAGFYRWRRLGKAVNLIMMAFWGITFGYLHIVPMFIAARMNVPLSDSLLARMDKAIGLEVPQVLEFAHNHPTLTAVLNASYDTLLFLIVLAIMLPPVCGKMRIAKEYAIGSLVAAMIALPLFAMFQALGPWTYYDFAPNAGQEEYIKTFLALKAEASSTIDFGYHNGLITFPSFHAVLAVLAGVALWQFPYIRWPALILSTMIVISTLTTGWHYVADVLGGLVVAGISVTAAKAYSRLENRFSPIKAGAPLAGLPQQFPPEPSP